MPRLSCNLMGTLAKTSQTSFQVEIKINAKKKRERERERDQDYMEKTGLVGKEKAESWSHGN